MGENKETIEMLKEITGVDNERARTILEINNNNLEQAINYHLENPDSVDFPGNFICNNDSLIQESQTHNTQQGKRKACKPIGLLSSDTSFVSENASLPDVTNGAANGMFSSNTNHIIDEDNVRAPIPTKQEQLLLPEEDQFRLNYNSVSSRKRRQAPSGAFTFCPFRDFAREAQIQEELSEEFNSFPYNSTSATVSNNLDPNSLDYATASLANFNNKSNGSAVSEDKNGSTARNKKKLISSTNGFDAKNVDKNSTSSSRRSKRKRLEDLFRPPIDLLFWGTFQAARDYATSLNRWLIINLQDQKEFKSQILNRDVWSDKSIKDIISINFILWQVSMENPEGLRFKTFYHVSECPYVCIIDPRTGENRLTCETTLPKNLYDNLIKFLTENDFCLDISLKVTKTTSRTASATATSSSSSCSFVSPSISIISRNNILTSVSNKDTKLEKYKTLELSEEDQLELAIKNSLKETRCSDSLKFSENTGAQINFDCNSETVEPLNTGEDSVANIADDDEVLLAPNEISKDFDVGVKNKVKNRESTRNKSTLLSYKDLLGNSQDSITKIQIRLPSGEKEDIEWPSSSVIKCLKLYICERYPDVTTKNYKLIQSYPRKNILDINDNITLFDAKLHPTSILYLHSDE